MNCKWNIDEFPIGFYYLSNYFRVDRIHPQQLGAVIIGSFNKAVEKTVHLGLQSDTDAEVLDGVTQGDKLISNPSASIQNGTLVKEK